MRTARQAEIFQAIADPTRRALLDLLLESERPVKSLVERFHISQPAISQHLRVLRHAGLVSERRAGRQRFYRLQGEALAQVADWLAHYEEFWRTKLAALGQHLGPGASEAGSQPAPGKKEEG
ncbi:MAG TPA: metalloregulator ArsR/SmtB family transcription factor [Terriglobales bacterium]|nr:metalloregulator ArsR/SmtB family transcription factor [Terriglobales bacterium]